MARVLIVEDELLIAEDLKGKLRRLGHTAVGHATTGETAVRKALETTPELILMDIRLRGEMNGIEAAARIRELHRVPIIYVTAHAAAVAAHATQQPGQFVVAKPFSMAELQSVIAVACADGGNDVRSES